MIYLTLGILLTLAVIFIFAKVERYFVFGTGGFGKKIGNSPLKECVKDGLEYEQFAERRFWGVVISFFQLHSSGCIICGMPWVISLQSDKNSAICSVCDHYIKEETKLKW